MDFDSAAKIVLDVLPETYQELMAGFPSGKRPNAHDEKLVIDVAQAILTWKGRLRKIKDPYVVWYFDGVSWSKVTKDMYQNEAYREWYKLTGGAKIKNNHFCETYYFLGSSDLDLSLSGRILPSIEELE